VSANVAAEKALQRAVALAPRDASAWCLLGDVRRKLCLLPAALDCYARCAALAADARCNSDDGDCATVAMEVDIVARKGRADASLAIAHQQLSAGNTAQVCAPLASVGLSSHTHVCRCSPRALLSPTPGGACGGCGGALPLRGARGTPRQRQ
jgi:hypothetical protein